MLLRFLRKKGLSTLSAFTLFFVGLCIIPCGALKEAHAAPVHDQMAEQEMAAHQSAQHGCHGKDTSTGEQISINEASSCPHCKSDVPVITQDAKIKYLSPELPLKLAHWQVEIPANIQKLELPEDDPPPRNGKSPIHILHSIFII